MFTSNKGLTAIALAAALLSGCGGGGGSTGGTGGAGTGTSGGSITCNTTHYTAGAVSVPTAGDMATYAKTYNGNTGTFNTGAFTSDGGAATFVLASGGSLTYNGTAQTVNSICKDTTLAMIYVEFGTTGAVDFFANGSFTGNLPNLTGVYGAAPAGAATPTVSGFSPATGVVGTTVTISGTNLGNFTPAPAVKFGTTVATVSSATATSIVVTVPASLAAGNSTITLSNFDGTGVVTVGTFNVTASGGGAAAFPNEAITLPSMDLNAITSPTMAATDVSSMVGTYTGTKAAYQTNVDTSQVVNYSTATITNSCQLTFAANRTLTLTDGTHTFTQTANDFWTHSLTGEANTGWYNAGSQSLGVGATGISMQIGRGKLIAVTAQVFTGAPAVMSEKLTCWMPINRTVGTAGSNMTAGTYYDNASDMPATAPGTYTSPLGAAPNVIVPVGLTCQLVVAADGSMTFTTAGLATDANITVHVAGDYDDRVTYTDATSWSYQGTDVSDPISGAYNTIKIQKTGGFLIMTVSSGTVRPLTSASYACM